MRLRIRFGENAGQDLTTCGFAGSLVLMEGVMRELLARLPPHFQLDAPTTNVSSKIIFQRLDINKDMLMRVRSFSPLPPTYAYPRPPR